MDYNRKRLQELAGIGSSGNVSKAIAYAESIKGAPYVWWKEGELTNGPPAWVEDGPPPLPEIVKEGGCNCTGLTNLMLRAVGKNIPGSGPYRGGTYEYNKAFKSVAEPFDINKQYPEGTLLIRDFRSVEDQGHVAVVLSNGKLFQSYDAGGGYPGVNKMISIPLSHAGYYYEFAVLPENWLG